MRLFLLFALFLTIAVPVSAQEANGTITTENSAQQDAAIAMRIREILGELGNYEDVTVIVNEGVVTGIINKLDIKYIQEIVGG